MPMEKIYTQWLLLMGCAMARQFGEQLADPWRGVWLFMVKEKLFKVVDDKLDFNLEVW